jgi:hypothetical protein
MAPHTNGTVPHPGEIDRIPVAELTVRDTSMLDRGAALLSELDDLIITLDSAITDAATARMVILDAESEMEVIAASIALGIAGTNEAARKAALTLALRGDAGYQVHAQAVRHARASLFTAERRIAVTKARIGLVRAALALLAGEER